MARCKSNELIAPVTEERVVGNDKRARTKLSENSKSRVNFICCCGFQDMEPNSLPRSGARPVAAPAVVGDRPGAAMAKIASAEAGFVRNDTGDATLSIEISKPWPIQ